jgi:hypothetical protein
MPRTQQGPIKVLSGKHSDATTQVYNLRTPMGGILYADFLFKLLALLTFNLIIMLKPFFVWQNKVLKSVNPQEVMCLSTEGNYTRIYLSDKSHYMVRSTLAGALKRLPPEMFIKTHRSFAASIYFIDNVARDHLTVGGEAIPIAKQYYNAVIEKLNIIK